jgi:hypothetical protein
VASTDTAPHRPITLNRVALPDARRASPAEIERQVAVVGASPVVAALLEAVDAALLVLNDRRQVVAWNGSPDRNSLPVGQRPGEVLGCVNSASTGGCGTTVSCETCGALAAVVGCEAGARRVESACLIPLPGGATAELDVRATPVRIGSERFTVVTLRDVSSERRREALEQIFFHDLLNTASGIRGWASRLGRPDADVKRAGARLDVLSRQLEREIGDHRALVLAESGTLVPSQVTVCVPALVEEVAALFAEHPAGRDRTLETWVSDPGLAVETDPALLGRVLVNMVRNALEATAPGGVVRLACTEELPTGALRFEVHNDGVIPDEVRPGVFRRSFSTKGRGRGLGTYGMKLLGERFLGGAVAFRSSPDAGTTFEFRLPRRPVPAASPGAPRARA